MRAVYLFLALAGVAFAQLSTDKQKALGTQLAAEIDHHAKAIADGEVTAYVDRILRKVSLDLPLELKLIDSPQPVASALPGGFIVLSSGAILQAESEAELAALLSHAIGHVLALKVTKSTSGLSVVFAAGWWGACVRSQVDHTSIPAGLLAQGADNEVQADTLGLDYLANAGYDPRSIVTVFDRWGVQSGPGDEVRAKVLALAPANTVWNTSEFARMTVRLSPPATTRRPPSLSR